jgi:hypothetical protein
VAARLADRHFIGLGALPCEEGTMAAEQVSQPLNQKTWRRVAALAILVVVFGGVAWILWPIVKAMYGWQ